MKKKATPAIVAASPAVKADVGKPTSPLRHFRTLSDKEVLTMWQRCVGAAIDYAQEIDMSGLSEGGSHNIYTALEHAIFDEWERAKVAGSEFPITFALPDKFPTGPTR